MTATMNTVDELALCFNRAFGKPRFPVVLAGAPGRTEIAGNHTDHQHGKVIAAAIDRGLRALAAENGTDEVHVHSTGYQPFTLHVSHTQAEPDEQVSPKALVRGMVAGMREAGVEVRGFDMVVAGNLPAGGGLSSSAAFELLVGCALDRLFAEGDKGPLALAHMAQRTECNWFGKPCGLMDQASIAIGGVVALDFENPNAPTVERLDVDFEELGYALCLVDVGCDHSRHTDEYTAVSQEMFAVARFLGAQVLRDLPEARFMEHLAAVRAQLGDRAALRAMHFYNEERLVDTRRDALKADDMDTFLAATRTSGASSARFLQNISCGGTDQPAMVALALAEHLLQGAGACRIHGGGFGGSIQAYVPVGQLEAFTAGMEEQFGPNSCQHLRVTDEGAHALWR